ncbi:uncharacterized protein [Physcomitrium patens]|uniref:uncharacterized protein n=1 Tax=Physcomitrium patens TaxID=3218 RepID=UPI003CCD0F41
MFIPPAWLCHSLHSRYGSHCKFCYSVKVEVMVIGASKPLLSCVSFRIDYPPLPRKQYNTKQKHLSISFSFRDAAGVGCFLRLAPQTTGPFSKLEPSIANIRVHGFFFEGSGWQQWSELFTDLTCCRFLVYLSEITRFWLAGKTNLYTARKFPR